MLGSNIKQPSSTVVATRQPSILKIAAVDVFRTSRSEKIARNQNIRDELNLRLAGRSSMFPVPPRVRECVVRTNVDDPNGNTESPAPEEEPEAETGPVYKFKCNFSGTVNDVLARRGWFHQTDEESDDWNMYFCDLFQFRDFVRTKPLSSLKADQRIAHFRNSCQIARKNLVMTNLKKLRYEIARVFGKEDTKNMCFFPTTYILPAENTAFVKEFVQYPESIWIVKPVNGAKGMGISIFEKFDDYVAWRKKFECNDLPYQIDAQSRASHSDGDLDHLDPDISDHASTQEADVLPPDEAIPSNTRENLEREFNHSDLLEPLNEGGDTGDLGDAEYDEEQSIENDSADDSANYGDFEDSDDELGTESSETSEEAEEIDFFNFTHFRPAEHHTDIDVDENVRLGIYQFDLEELAILKSLHHSDDSSDDSFLDHLIPRNGAILNTNLTPCPAEDYEIAVLNDHKPNNYVETEHLNLELADTAVPEPGEVVDFGDNDLGDLGEVVDFGNNGRDDLSEVVDLCDHSLEHHLDGSDTVVDFGSHDGLSDSEQQDDDDDEWEDADEFYLKNINQIIDVSDLAPRNNMIDDEDNSESGPQNHSDDPEEEELDDDQDFDDFDDLDDSYADPDSLSTQEHKNCIFIVQRYIPTPYLIGGKKFDLRIYILVTSFSSLTAWVHREGFARFSSDQFSLESMADDYVHLTNVSIQKKADEYNEAKGTKWSLNNLREYMTSKHGRVEVERMMRQFDDIIIRTLQSVEAMMGKHRKCFELYGFDILIDDTLKPWLLEVNSAPAFTPTSEEDYRMKCDLVDDMMHVLDIENQRAGTETRVGGFDLIWSDGPVYSAAAMNDIYRDKNLKEGGIDEDFIHPKLNSYLGATNADRIIQLRKMYAAAHATKTPGKEKQDSSKVTDIASLKPWMPLSVLKRQDPRYRTPNFSSRYGR